MAQRGSPDAILPSAETIGAKLNALDSYPQKVATHQPQKNSRKPTRSLPRQRWLIRWPTRRTQYYASRGCQGGRQNRSVFLVRSSNRTDVSTVSLIGASSRPPSAPPRADSLWAP